MTIPAMKQNDLFEFIMNDSNRSKFIVQESENDIELFGLHYFPEYFYRPFSQFHYWMFDKFHEKKKDKRIGIAAPRSFAKTTIISFLFPIWAMAYGKKKYILIISETATQSQAFLSDIIVELESNSELRNDFPGLLPAIDEKNQYVKWTDSDIILQNGIKVSARGTGAKLRGLKKSNTRPDLIILDDCEDDEMVQTYSRRQKIKSWFDKVIMNVGDTRGCDVYLLGTILHYDSLLKTVMDRDSFMSRLFKSFTTVDGIDKPLWPEVWSMPKLMKKKSDIGIVAFQSEFQNEPIEEENAIFKLKYFNFFDEIDKDITDIYFGVDLAISESTKADYTVIAVIGVKEKQFYILDIWRNKVQFNEILISIEKMAERYKPVIIGVEDVAFQKSVIQELVRTTKLPIKPIKVSRDKRVRASSLSVHFEQGKVHVKKSLPDIVDEFLSFPSGAHDDIVDAVGHGIWLASLYPAAEPPKKGREQRTKKNRSKVQDLPV